MNKFQIKIDQCRNHLLNQDIDLGFRKLVDCVLDTQQLNLYSQVIEIVSWQDENPTETEGYLNKLHQLIVQLERIQIPDKGFGGTLISTSNLEKKYARSSFSIGPIDIELKAGEIWGLVGENGNGKTSLLRVLAKDLAFDSGSIDYQLEDSTNYKLRTQLVYIPQRTPKWYGSLKSNLKFTATQYGLFKEENELTVLMYIIRFGLWKFRNHAWSELSSGYKMRFELARTFLRRPKLLLLDEPLANLDVLAQQLVLEDLKNMSQSLSNPLGIVLSSQQLFEVEKIADKLIFLKNGKPIYVNHNGESESSEEESQTILEMDLEIEKEQLSELLLHLSLEKINFNGGVFIAHFNKKSCINEVLQVLINNNIQLIYVRDISKSTRRFFIQKANS
ncbi:ATP-binding cassette domain-containing protein [Fluviicola taffensis]|uniref:ABC transporter related protein n=1 Tax=Fluviicola taffensis (strain DSM 16823 / NCIMB 13979 / RW262) TaxID=755732 RepID=F2IBZ0_FLUTR|nr:ABC transporter ATP-binding protein [Fluviicola taffensis]AEA42218.1 ABC transporter related protein [Fluviicola taffensis DSM 16823]